MLSLVDHNRSLSIDFHGLPGVDTKLCWMLANNISQKVRFTKNQCNVVVHLSKDNGQDLSNDDVLLIQQMSKPNSAVAAYLDAKGVNAKVSEVLSAREGPELVMVFKDTEHPQYDYVGFIRAVFAREHAKGHVVRLGITVVRLNRLVK